VGYPEFHQRAGEALTVDATKVRFFPCAEYNFTIEADRQYPPAELKRKAFIHFKGNRKAMQAQYLAAMRAGAV